jgi:signal transduction histidine kinase
VNRLRTRLEDSLDQAGIALPWWLPIAANGISLLLAVAAVAQRGGDLVFAGLLTVLTTLGWAVTGRIAPPWLKASTVIAAVALLLTHPVVPDFAPVLFVMLVAEVAAISQLLVALLITGACMTVLVVAAGWVGLIGWAVYVAAVLLGLCGGLLGRWYVRALAAERSAKDAVREQAALAERQRIAREVHDVVAHSLSITMLHLTGARHALQEDRDIDDAIEGLLEAERVGRAAMADIRRTVGLLSRAPAGTHPMPHAQDIAELVWLTRAAGVDVRYEQGGDLDTVTAVAGLGLYRIAQESLANITKHAPGAAGWIRLCADATGVRLTVRNTLPDTGASTVDGSGLVGMAARATQLGAEFRVGPDGPEWVVDVRVPVVA